MPPPSLTQWEPVGLTVPAPFLRADGAEAMSSLARLIASGAVSSRTDLAKRTGLARSTIGAHLDRLQASGLIREAGIAEPEWPGPARPTVGVGAGLGCRAGGRPRRAWRPAGRCRSRPAVTCTGNTLRSAVQGAGEHAGVGRGAVAGRCYRRRDASPDRVRTMAVGLPGPVDRSTGTPVQTAIDARMGRLPCRAGTARPFRLPRPGQQRRQLDGVGRGTGLAAEPVPLGFHQSVHGDRVRNHWRLRGTARRRRWCRRRHRPHPRPGQRPCRLPLWQRRVPGGGRLGVSHDPGAAGPHAGLLHSARRLHG